MSLASWKLAATESQAEASRDYLAAPLRHALLHPAHRRADPALLHLLADAVRQCPGETGRRQARLESRTGRSAADRGEGASEASRRREQGTRRSREATRSLSEGTRRAADSPRVGNRPGQRP